MADVEVVIYDGKIEAMTAPGGMVFKWAYQRRKRVERIAKQLCPVRSGNLRDSIEGEYTKVPNGVVMYVRAGGLSTITQNGRSYAVYVHEGTEGLITAHPPKPYMVLRPGISKKTGVAYGRLRKKAVAGQDAQPFLSQ
ncbi:MAG TPA: hypothetical protein VFV76_05860, partial [Actinomycetes bacterium]|nr:hypothetical protein [Actinomycetes bacterium]